jgi:hypothetical protein
MRKCCLSLMFHWEIRWTIWYPTRHGCSNKKLNSSTKMTKQWQLNPGSLAIHLPHTSPLLFTYPIHWRGCLPSSLLFFLQWALLIGPSPKKLKLGRLSQSSSFSVLSRLWLTYIDKKRRTLGKGYGIKWGATENTLRNTLWTWGTSWGTHWKHRRTQEEF